MSDGSPQKISTYNSKMELRQLAPGRTIAMRPIEDVAIWTKATDEKTVRLVDAWNIPGEALDLAIEFVNTWRRVNGTNHPATVDRPMPLPNPNAPSVASSEPELSLYAGDSCDVRAGGGCVTPVNRGVIDSVEGVPNSLRPMVLQQIEDLNKRGQKSSIARTAPPTARRHAGSSPITSGTSPRRPTF